jgi:hypothetical protein
MFSRFDLHRALKALPILLVGISLLWLSWQPYSSVKAWLDPLAADGNLESFSPERYNLLALGLKAAGSVLIAAALWSSRREYKPLNILAHLGYSASRLWSDGITLWHEVRMATNDRTFSIVLAIMFAGAILRLRDINDSVGYDEAYTYVVFASGSLWRTISDYHLPNNHIFMSFLVNLLTHIFGNTLWIIRLPALFAGLLLIPAMYLLSKSIYSKETGLLSAILVACFPELVLYSTVARGYIFVALATVLNLGLSDYVCQYKNRFAWLLIVIFSAFGFYSIPVMLMPFGIYFTWMGLRALIGDQIAVYQSKWEFFKFWGLAGFASAVLTVLLYAPILVTDPHSLLDNPFVKPVAWNDYFPDTLTTRLLNTWRTWTDYIPPLIVGLGIAGIVLAIVFNRRISRPRVALHIAALLWLTAFVVLRRPNGWPRIWLFLTPLFLMWAAAGSVEPLKRVTLRIGTQGWALSTFLNGFVAITLAVQSLIVIPALPGEWRQQANADGVAAYLSQELRPGDLVVIGSTSNAQVWYYFIRYNIPDTYLDRNQTFQRVFVVVTTNYSQETLEKVVNKFLPDSSQAILGNSQLVKAYGNFEIYESVLK